MKQELRQLIEKLYDQYLRRKRWQKVVTFLAAVVVFCTTYALILPAITLETTCGYEEHVHEAVCYEGENIEGLLICEKEEHSHVEECYPDDEPEVISESVEEENIIPEESVETVSGNAVSEETAVEEIIPGEAVAEETVSEESAAEEIISEEAASEAAAAMLSSEEEITAAAETAAETVSDDADSTILVEGKLTDTVWWKIIEDEFGYQTLTIGGEGAMPDFTVYTE